MNRLPSVFVSHGAPTFALEPGRAGAALAALGRRLPRPQAVLVVSPHWSAPGPRVATTAQPRTIHDFGGFAPALYEIDYPAPGHPALAQRALALLAAAGWAPQPDPQRGLDHGAWVPLRHLYPDADVPAFQVALPARLDADAAWELGAALAPLAAEGVLIVGSGSLTHNLSEFGRGRVADAGYAQEFAAWVRAAVAAGDPARLRQTLARAPHAVRAHPSAEHFWPLLVAAAAAPAPLPAQLIDGGVVDDVFVMDGFVFGELAVASAG